MEWLFQKKDRYLNVRKLASGSWPEPTIISSMLRWGRLGKADEQKWLGATVGCQVP